MAAQLPDRTAFDRGFLDAMTYWQSGPGGYEYEIGIVPHDYTGWVRCPDGRLADGSWPNWHQTTGATR